MVRDRIDETTPVTHSRHWAQRNQACADYLMGLPKKERRVITVEYCFKCRCTLPDKDSLCLRR